MDELDLHGVRHAQVDRLVENFVFQKEPPCRIITGNSQAMQGLVIAVLNRNGFKYEINLGSIVVY